MDLYLKFKDKAEADSVIYVDATAEELQFVYRNTDVVGTIYKPTGVLLKEQDGMEYPEMKALDGYHVNIRLFEHSWVEETDAETGETVNTPVIPKELKPYVVIPSTPSRVWG